MEREGFISIGETKMVDIDFTVVIPSSGYYATINILTEFSQNGQVIPTRIDILPYKLSPFTLKKEDNTSIIDYAKFCLVIYTAYAVYLNFALIYRRKGGGMKGMLELMAFSSIFDNFGDIMTIFLQTFCFFVKIQDGGAFDIDPQEVLLTKNRMKYQSIYFYANNFRNF
jgi:hypothetical protein